MRIIIENREFDFDSGCKLLKLKYDECPEHLTEVADLWDDIVPMSFVEICQISNMENRRVAINCLGIRKLTEYLEPELVSEETISKSSMWVVDGELVEHNFEDTYKLFRIDQTKLFNGAKHLWNQGRTEWIYYVECKDTSTDRKYLIWIDYDAVDRIVNVGERVRWSEPEKRRTPDAIDAIAWTITVPMPRGRIEKIVRQGDCILVKPKWEQGEEHSYEYVMGNERHLTAEEYRTLIVAES